MSSKLATTVHAARRIAAIGLPGAVPVSVDEGVSDALLGHLVNQRLTGFAVEGVRSGNLLLPDGAARELSELHLRASILVVALERKLLAIDRLLREGGVDPVVLKGPALGRPFYGEVARTYGDIDLLVPAVDWRAALDVLARSGFRRLIPEPRPGFDERFGKGASHADPDGYEIDLHRTLALGPFGLWVDPYELASRAVPFPLHGRSLRRLGDAETLLHVCLHASLGSHPPQLLPLRDVLQVAYSDTVDWMVFARLARRWRIVAPVSWALRRASETLGVPLPPAAMSLDLGSPRTIERWALRSYVSDRRGTGGIELATLVALPGVRDRIEYSRALLFPDRHFRAERGSGRSERWSRVVGWGRDRVRRRRRRKS